MDAASKSALAFESPLTRRSIIASYFLVIILALPLWWNTTSIERQALPVSRVTAQAGRELAFPIRVALDTRDYEIGTDAFTQEVRRHIASSEEFKQNGLSVQISSEAATANGYQVVLRRGTRDPTVDGRKVTMEIPPEHAGVAAMQLADTLATLLTPYTSLRSSQTERVVSYSPRYRLAFTLLNEDAASGNAALSWDVHGAMTAQVSPLLERLSVLHNFTVESQVQYHGPLAFDPRALQGDEYGLTPEDLTVFVNSAEWTLSSSVSNDPVLHFVAFIPSSKHSPLRILGNDDRPTSSSAFILPQWGGVVLCNPNPAGVTRTLAGRPLDAIFATFRQQLSALLGVPELAPHVHAQTQGSAGVTDWQLDALVRRRAVENAASAQETLQSIVRLVAQIEDMPVGEDVRGDVQGALAALDQTYSAASSSANEALTFASKAQSVASRAFFNPGMLALLYFPAEHKWAVYAPLFASVTAPLLASVIREVLAWKKERKAKVGETRTAPEQTQKTE